jgi:hypothetical protein
MYSVLLLAVGLPEKHLTSESGIFVRNPFSCSHRCKEVLAHTRPYNFASYHKTSEQADNGLPPKSKSHSLDGGLGLQEKFQSSQDATCICDRALYGRRMKVASLSNVV